MLTECFRMRARDFLCRFLHLDLIDSFHGNGGFLTLFSCSAALGFCVTIAQHYLERPMLVLYSYLRIEGMQLCWTRELCLIEVSCCWQSGLSVESTALET
jgi:hypothetical protein